MTKDQVHALPNRAASEIAKDIIQLGDEGRRQLALALESNMTLQWWRGYWAGRDAAKAEGKPE